MAQYKMTVDLDMDKNQLVTPLYHKLASAPSSPVEGQFYYNTSDKKVYRYDGTQWITDGSGSITTITGTVGSGGTAQNLGITPSGATVDINVPLATTSLDGALSASDKTKLNNATASSTANTLVLRDANGTFSIGAPTSASHPATKSYVDSALSGLDFQKDILNIQVDATLNPGSSPTTGDRYILTNTGALHANFGSISGVANNDIVEYNGSAFVVAYDVSAQGEGALVWNRNDNKWYRWDGTSWDEFGGLSGVTAGAGLTKTGNQLDIVSANAGITVNADNIQLNVDNSTVEIGGGAVRVKDAGITFAKIASGVWGSSLDTTGSVVNVKNYTAVTGTTVGRVFVSASTSIGSGSPVTFTHNLGVQRYSVQVIEASTGQPIGVYWVPNGTNPTTQIDVTANGTAFNAYVVVIG